MFPGRVLGNNLTQSTLTAHITGPVAESVPTADTQPALDPPPAPQRERKREQQPQDRGVEDRVDREAGRQWPGWQSDLDAEDVFLDIQGPLVGIMPPAGVAFAPSIHLLTPRPPVQLMGRSELQTPQRPTALDPD